MITHTCNEDVLHCKDCGKSYVGTLCRHYDPPRPTTVYCKACRGKNEYYTRTVATACITCGKIRRNLVFPDGRAVYPFCLKCAGRAYVIKVPLPTIAPAPQPAPRPQIQVLDLVSTPSATGPSAADVAAQIVQRCHDLLSVNEVLLEDKFALEIACCEMTELDEIIEMYQDCDTAKANQKIDEQQATISSQMERIAAFKRTVDQQAEELKRLIRIQPKVNATGDQAFTNSLAELGMGIGAEASIQIDTEEPTCPVCVLKDVEAIDAAFQKGDSLRTVEDRFGVPRTTLARHKQRCLKGS